MVSGDARQPLFTHGGVRDSVGPRARQHVASVVEGLTMANLVDIAEWKEGVDEAGLSMTMVVGRALTRVQVR